jgi:hypothetical protein
MQIATAASWTAMIPTFARHGIGAADWPGRRSMSHPLS